MSDAQDVGGSTPVGVTDHAAARWHQRRACWPGVGPKIAWEQATPLHDTSMLDCDAARYHEETDLVLVAKRELADDGLVLVTAIRGDGASSRIHHAIEEVID